MFNAYVKFKTFERPLFNAYGKFKTFERPKSMTIPDMLMN